MTAVGNIAGFWSAFKVFSKSMTRGDAYFHLLLAGCAVGGTLFAQGIGESLWQRHNSGVRTRNCASCFAISLVVAAAACASSASAGVYAASVCDSCS